MSFSTLVCHLLLLLVMTVDALNQDGIALLSFKDSITEDPHSSLSSWNSSSETPCSWNGITCSSSKSSSSNVISIALPKSGLKGNISRISLPPLLRHLNIRDNDLVGPLPPSLFNSSCSSLQSLVLSFNSFSGPLPLLLLRNCARLRSLDLAHNSFSGSLPSVLPQTLQRLDVSHNRFSGPIPDAIGNLSRLEGTADLSHNLFSGSIPATLGNLPERVYIDLSYNNLTGPIPQHGALVNRGPTAFAGNPGLCGTPLKNPCGDDDNSSSVTTPTRRSKKLSKGVITALVLSHFAGIAVSALVFYFIYLFCKKRRGKEEKDDDDVDSSSEIMGQTELISLDRSQIGFSLNELLQSTAFVLGKSEFGIVYKVVMNNGLTVAVRRLGEGGSQRFKEFHKEVEAIGRVRHSNIVPLRAYYWSREEKLLIYDYIPGGNLSTAIHGRDGDSGFSPLSWGNRLKIMKGMAKGLAFLHESSPKKYVHGDIKPNNILLGLNMTPYISDFGLGRLAYIAEGSTPERPQNQLSDAAVSPVTSSRLCYNAPEALKTPKPSQKWDVYSFGVILLELISGQSPILLLDTQEMDLVRWFMLCINERKPLIDVLDPYIVEEPDIEDEVVAALKIALACVESSPERRPPMKRVAETLERLSARS